MTTAERYLSFSTPPVISSSEFVTEFIEFAPSGSNRDFRQGDAFTISLANLNKAQYLIPDSCFLTFDVSVLATPATGTAVVNTEGPGIGPYGSIDFVPRPRFGCPYFETASVSVPGSSTFDAMPPSAEEASAYWYSTRLLCSSVEGEGTADRAYDFRLPGRYNFAGGKSGRERQDCIVGARRYSGNIPGNTADTFVAVRGNTMSVSYPLSAFCTLFCKASSLIPIGMLSSGGEALVFSMQVARSVESVLGTGFNGTGTGFESASFTILNPRIICSVVKITNPMSVAQLSALYDARVKMAIPSPSGPPTEIAVPMVIAHKRFVWARTVVPKTPGAATGSSSNMALTFSGVNEPSVSAIVLRMRYRPSNEPASLRRRQLAGVLLGSDEPAVCLKNLQVRLNDQLIPLRGISDEGLTNLPMYATGGALSTKTLSARTSGGLSSTLFDLGRHGMGLFMEDDHSKSLSDIVFDKNVQHQALLKGFPVVSTAGSAVEGLTKINIYPEIGDFGTLSELSPHNPPSCDKHPVALFIIPLCSFPQLVGDYSNAHTLRSWDLRSVSSFTVSGTVQVIDESTGDSKLSDLSAPVEDVIVDGALVCDGMLRLAAGSSDSRYQYTAVANATVSAS